MKSLNVVTLVAFSVLAAGTAFAFGTVSMLGQNLEHERITRRAFACTGAATDDCFQKKTLASLAGAPGDFGAVGTPDRGTLIFKADAHCDAGDYFDVAGYPQTKADAQAKIEACRAWMLQHLNAAVTDAAGLLDANGKIRDSEIPTIIACRYGGTIKGRAKCNVLEHFGILLHASQDFYSHTNWTDAADTRAPSSPANPPGLNKRGPAPYLNLRASQFPAGLISGCFEAQSAISEPANCNYGPAATPRVKHLALNKDKGKIDPQIGAGTTDRGKINDNFRHAVEAAIADTQDKWATLKERLATVYGAERGKKMICALTRDDPVKTC